MSWQLSNGKEGSLIVRWDKHSSVLCFRVARAERVRAGDAIKNQRD